MANPTGTTIIAVFRSASDATAAAQELQTAGIPQQDIYLEAANSGGAQDFHSRSAHHEGGFVGWMKNLFGGDEHAADLNQYESAYGSGNYLLSVDAAQHHLDNVEEILNRHNPVNIHEGTDSAYNDDPSRNAALPADEVLRNATNTPAGARAVNGDDAIPVVEEELQVGKRRVLRGGVRVFSRVVETPVDENITLQEEHVRVDRRPVDRPATEADLNAGREQVVEVEEYAEEPVVARQARVVEEVRVGKDVEQRQQAIHDTVRHTEVEVEPVRANAAAAAVGTASDETAIASRYGTEMAGDARYRGRSFDEVENDLRSDYGRRYPNNSWDKVKNSIRTGWNTVANKA